MIKEFPKKRDSFCTDCITQISENSNLDSNDYELIKAIALTLSQIVKKNKSKPNYKKEIKEHHNEIIYSNSIPLITIKDYLLRIQKYTRIEDNTLIIALIYIDRICKNKNVILTDYNTHRIIFASIISAIKYHEDKYYSNKYYAKVAGLSLKQLNDLEYYFLSLIDFNLYVDSKMYEKYERNLILLLQN